MEASGSIGESLSMVKAMIEMRKSRGMACKILLKM
jgi:hypothetical protein